MDVRQRTTAGNWFRYLLRFVGLLGLLAAVFGFAYLVIGNAWPEVSSLGTAIQNAFANPTIDGVLLLVAAIGTVVAVAWIAAELAMGLTLVTSQRAAAGSNIYAQITLAALLALVVNAIGFRHYARFDCTRDAAFTLPSNLVDELRTLGSESPTDVVVLQLHKSAIARGGEPDNIDKAAELKVVEKVNDLVDQLRELGPRFRVTVLDKQDEYYQDKVDKLAPALRKAMAGVPEDSIFFHANGRVRRMSFAEFYRVDKTASRKSEDVATPDGKTETRVRSVNLVLLPQGREEFVKRLLSLEQRTPRIGLVTIHPELSTRESGEDLSAAGLRKSLEANGFEVVDIITKKWGRGGPTPAAFTYEEYELDRLENRFNLISMQIQILTQQMETFVEVGKKAQTEPLSELNRLYSRQIRRSITTEEDRRFLLDVLSSNVAMRKSAIDELNPELFETETKLKELQKNEKAGEGRRVTDIPAKLKSAINDCDLLIIPRLTSMDLAKGYVIRPTFYTMPKDQAEAIRDFIKSGKPVLACFGPNKFGPANEAEPDDLEKVFTRLGIEFGSQTVLTEKEARAAAERQGDGLGSATELPPLVLDFDAKSEKQPNPVRTAFLIAGRAVDGKLELHRSGPRPVYVSPSMAAKLPFAATILQSVKESWNEEKPLPEEDYVPKYEPAKLDDPKRGTPDEERRGPFSIGVAIETKVPAEWYDESLSAAQAASTIGAAAGGLGLACTTLKMDAENFAAPGQLPSRPTVRIAAFGHGGLFVGKELSPAQEQLLLTTLNWQLHRDELLPRDAGPESRWQFPRVAMSEQQKKLWHMGTFLGMPMVCAFCGVVVLMTRKLR